MYIVNISKHRLTPSSLVSYINVTRDVYGVVPPYRGYAAFSSLDTKLRKLHIDPYDYAIKLLNHLYKWVISKSWKCLPAHIYTSQWALDLYVNEISTLEFTHISDDDENELILLAEEIFVVTYMYDKRLPYDEAIYALWRILSPEWKASYEYRSHIALHDKAITLYNEAYTR